MTRTGPEPDDWERHWAEYAESAAANPAQDFRRRLVLRLLQAGERARILDIGSGTGDLLSALRRAHPGAELVGVELSRTGVELARRKVRGATVLQRNLLVSEPPPPEFTAWATRAVCSEVLEHVDEPTRLLENAAAYLAPGCRLVVTVPGGPMTAYDRHIGHRRHFQAEELAQVLRDAGFAEVSAGGAGFPLFDFYRFALRVLGARVIEVAGAPRPSLPARTAMGVFGSLLRLQRRVGRRGQQIVATARFPGPSG